MASRSWARPTALTRGAPQTASSSGPTAAASWRASLSFLLLCSPLLFYVVRLRTASWRPARPPPVGARTQKGDFAQNPLRASTSPFSSSSYSVSCKRKNNQTNCGTSGGSAAQLVVAPCARGHPAVDHRHGAQFIFFLCFYLLFALLSRRASPTRLSPDSPHEPQPHVPTFARPAPCLRPLPERR